MSQPTTDTPAENTGVPAGATPAAAANSRGLAAVVVNPTKTADLGRLRTLVTTKVTQAGWPEPLWLETTADDPGYGMTEKALAEGATVVLAAGGDGTVRAVLTVLAGTDTALAVLPLGTGNLLARNLGMPLNDLPGSVDIALGAGLRRLDVGRIEPDSAGERAQRFVIMAGVGLDAAIMRDAPENVKARIGWAAYLVSGAKHLRREQMHAHLVIDGRTEVRARAQTIVIGNVGKLQGGLQLLPDAVPDDGYLDVAVLESRGVFDWLLIAGRVISRRPDVDDRFATYRGKRIEVRLPTPSPRQVDGDLLTRSDRLLVEVEPAAVIVKVVPAPIEPEALLQRVEAAVARAEAAAARTEAAAARVEAAVDRLEAAGGRAGAPARRTKASTESSP